MQTLSQVTIGITSFLRAGYLRASSNSIAEFLPECHVLIADDSGPYLLDEIKKGGFDASHPITTLPFDSGLSAKRNRLIDECRTKYFLLWTDDFKADRVARAGITRMLEILESRPTIDIAAGRVDNVAYEAMLEYRPGSYLQEHKISSQWRYPELVTVDIAANYFLAHTASIRGVRWEERCKIGGEHALWWLKVKQSGLKAAWIPGSIVNTFQFGAEAEDPRYRGYRSRALTQGHQVMKQILNIREFRGMNGDVS